MVDKPSTLDVLKLIADGGRVSLAEVQKHPHGVSFAEPAAVVQPKDPGWPARLDVANADMMDDLAALTARTLTDASTDPEFPFRLICRRTSNAYNSAKRAEAIQRGRPYNPAFVHPADLIRLNIADGDEVSIVSARGSIPAVVSSDSSLRIGVVSMSHGFGAAPELDSEYLSRGSSTSRLLDNTVFADRYVGMPLMSNVPVAIRRLASPLRTDDRR